MRQSLFRFTVAFLIVLGLSFPSAAANRYALLIGVSDYIGQGSFKIEDLQGPKNDVLLMQRTLRHAWGDGTQISVLANGLDKAAYATTGILPLDPTKANILEALGQLADKAEPGDEVLIYYSGHGSQLPALEDAENEPDGRDETLLPSDAKIDLSDDGKTFRVRNHIRDNEIHAAIITLRARGAFVWLIVDACHSGTINRTGAVASINRYVRFPPDSARTVIDEDLGQSVEPVEGALASSQTGAITEAGLSDGLSAFGGFVGFFAAGENMLALEKPFQISDDPADSVHHGVMTWFLAQALKSGAGATYASLSERLRNAMWRDMSGELPVTIGDLGRAPMVAWSNTTAFALTSKNGRLGLQAGRLNGLTSGSLLDVFRSGDDEGGPVFTVRVTNASLDQSDVEVVEDDPHHPSRISEIANQEGTPSEHFISDNLGGLAAVMNSKTYSFRLRVAAPAPCPAKSQACADVAKRIDQALAINAVAPFGFSIDLAPASHDADLRLIVLDGALWFAPKDGVVITDGPYRTPSLGLATLKAADILQTLSQMGRARNLLEVAADFSTTDLSKDIDVALTFEPEEFDTTTKACRLSHAVMQNPTPIPSSDSTPRQIAFGNPIEVPLCSKVSLRVRNFGSRVVDVSAFYFDQHGNIYNMSGYPEGTNFVLKLDPGYEGEISYGEGMPTTETDTPAPDQLLLGPMRIVLFMIEGEAVPYTNKTLQYLAGKAPASIGARLKRHDLVGLLDQAGYGVASRSVSRVAEIARTAGARIVPINLVAPPGTQF